MGALILADTLQETNGVLYAAIQPLDLRLCACRAIVNALALALQRDAHSPDQKSAASILLLDPYPEYMSNALRRTGNSILILYRANQLSLRSAETMFSVVSAGLEIISQVSYTALDSLPALRQQCSELGI